MKKAIKITMTKAARDKLFKEHGIPIYKLGDRVRCRSNGHKLRLMSDGLKGMVGGYDPDAFIIVYEAYDLTEHRSCDYVQEDDLQDEKEAEWFDSLTKMAQTPNPFEDLFGNIFGK